MKDRRRLEWSIGLAALGAVLGLVYCIWIYGWIHGHRGWWGSPTDSYVLTDAGSLLLHGHLKAVYSAGGGLYALPLSFPFTGLAGLLVSWTHLPGAPHQEWILVVIPSFSALAVPALFQARALAWQLGLRRHLWAVQLVTAVLVIPPLVEWGHVEDVLALAFTLSAVRHLVNHNPVRACLHLSIALSFKQWALLLVPLAVLAAPHGNRMRAFVAAGTLPAVLAAFFLAIDFQPVMHALTDPSSELIGFPGHVSILGAWLGPRSSQITRMATIGIAAGIGYRRRWTVGDPLALVTSATLILLARPLLETTNYSYYWTPSLVLLMVVAAAGRGRVSARDWVWPVLALVWTLPQTRELTALTWWTGEALLLGAAIYRLRHARLPDNRDQSALLPGTLSRPQPAGVSG